MASSRAPCALHDVSTLFVATFKCAPEVRASAPGRVNVIGEHTDYNGGFVLPIAIERRTHVVGVKHASGDTCRIVSTLGDGVVEFTANKAALVRGEPSWANYVKGVIAQYLVDLPGGVASFDLAIASDVPLGGGLSSSASLEIAIATFLEVAYGLRIDPKVRALRCQKCEHDFAGVPCGIMDQMVSSCGQSGHALLIDCIPPFTTQLVPLNDPSVVFVVANSNVKHKLEGSEYPTRVRECRSAAVAIRKRFPVPPSDGAAAEPLLRGATMAELLACKEHMTPIEFQRARHVIGEDVRTIDAVEALRQRDYATAGRLMVESHNSLRDDFGVSTAELDALVEIATRVEGVYGARMTGGGFGGCTVTLVKAEHAAALIKTIEDEYTARVGTRPTCFVTHPASGPTGSWSPTALGARRGLRHAWRAYRASCALARLQATHERIHPFPPACTRSPIAARKNWVAVSLVLAAAAASCVALARKRAS
jgi:galactokinase